MVQNDKCKYYDKENKFCCSNKNEIPNCQWNDENIKICEYCKSKEIAEKYWDYFMKSMDQLNLLNNNEYVKREDMLKRSKEYLSKVE